MHRKFRVDYDAEHDSLFLYREKSHGSVEIGNLVLDFDRKRDLVGLEMLDASKVLQSMNVSELRVTKRLLASIADCRIETKDENGMLVIKVFLHFENEQQLITPLMVPSIKEPSPFVVEA